MILNVNEWVTFACNGTSPADESKRTKHVLGWSRLNWLSGILIVSWHIHFYKLLMLLTPICCFANEVQGLQKLIISILLPKLMNANNEACEKDVLVSCY